MKIFTGLSGWLCLSALLSSFKTGEALDSISRCKLSFSASGSSQSVSLAAEAVADASAYVCDGGKVAESSVHVIAEATAKAAAVAVARATAKCYSEGNASFKVNGRSLAKAHAYAYAEAYAAGMVQADVCNKCSASAEFVAESWSELFLTAVAEAELELEGSGTAEVNADIFVESVAEAVVTAYAEVLVEARAAVDDGCSGSIIGTVITGDEDEPDGASCVVTVRGEDAGYAKNAVAEAAVVISDVMCGDAPRQVDDVSKAFAKAVAKAIAEVTLDCEVFGNAYACALGDADVVSVAEATATAVAKLVVETNLLDTDCKCEISAEAILRATETIIAEASASAWAEVCSGESFFEQDLNVKIERKIATAFAGVWAKILEGCAVDAEIVAEVKTCKDCAKHHRRCYSGNNADVKGCCNKAHKCVKRTSRSGFCIDPKKTPGYWKGDLLACT